MKKIKIGLIALATYSLVASAAITSSNLDNIVRYSKAEKKNPKYVAMDKTAAHEAALKMNEMIRDALYETGVYNDRKFTTSDAYTLKDYVSNEMGEEFRAQLAIFSKLTTQSMSIPLLKYPSAVNLYSARYSNVSATSGLHVNSMRAMAIFFSMSTSREAKKGNFYNANKIIDYSKTGTGLDRIIPFILKEKGLNYNLPKSSLITAAKAAAQMNVMLVDAIRETGVADNKNISAAEIKILNEYILANNAQEWQDARGAAGYGKIHNRGAVTLIGGENRINHDGRTLYQLGFESPYNTDLVYKNGQIEASYGEVSYRLNGILRSSYKNGTLHSSNAQ